MRVLYFFIILLLINIELLSYDKNLKLSQNELDFLKKSPTLEYVYDPNWKPLEWRNNIDQHVGIIADLLKIVEKKSGISFQPIASKNWNDALNKLKNAKAQMVSAAAYTEDRAKYLNFTKHNLFTIRNVFISKKTDSYKNGFKDLKDKRVAIIKGYAIESILKKKYPDLKLLTVPSVDDGFNELLDDKIDVFIVNQAVGQYVINENAYNGLKISYITDFTLDLKIAFRKDVSKEYLSIIDKTLSLIDEDDVNKIYRKWFFEASKIAHQNEVYSSLDMDIYKIIPFKEIILIIFIITILFTLMLKYLRKKDISLTIPVSVFVFIFLSSSLVITLNSISTLEKLKKQEIEQSLGTVVNVTYKAIKEWFELYKNVLNYSVDNSEFISITKELVQHKNSDEFLIKNSNILNNHFQELKHNIDDVKNFFVISKDYKILASSNSAKVAKNVQNKYLKDAVDKALKKGYAYLMPSKISSDTTKLFHNLYFLVTINEKHSSNSLAVYVVGVDPSSIQLIAQQGRIGVTGETYLVNNKDELISQSRFDNGLKKVGILKENQRSFLNVKVQHNGKKTKAVDFAIKNIIGSDTDGYLDYRGIRVFGSWIYDSDLDIIIITEIDEDDAMHSFNSLRVAVLSVVFAIIAFTILLMGFILFLTNHNKKILKEKNLELEKFSQSLEQKVYERTKELEILNKHTRDSIEYASLIQHALIPDNEDFKRIFSDYFTIWQPKDIVGGDIYLFEESDDVALLMVIDCTGHGVPGAFVTMLVKALERQLLTQINTKDDDISPAWILSYFNRSMKKLLKQENKDSISNAGFDGGIICYNKKDKYIKFAGAETSLFYIKDDELVVKKGSRHSIGYKKSKADYKFDEHFIKVEDGMKFYITTDGYLDQNGGEKDFPFGKKRFAKLLKEIHSLSFCDQKERLLNELNSYQGSNERNDDVTVIGFKI